MRSGITFSQAHIIFGETCITIFVICRQLVCVRGLIDVDSASTPSGDEHLRVDCSWVHVDQSVLGETTQLEAPRHHEDKQLAQAIGVEIAPTTFFKLEVVVI